MYYNEVFSVRVSAVFAGVITASTVSALVLISSAEHFTLCQTWRDSVVGVAPIVASDKRRSDEK